MAMVVIKKGSRKIKVAYGAFKGMYERAGWELANASDAKKQGGDKKSSSEASPKNGHRDEEQDDNNEDVNDQEQQQEKDEWDEADEELAQESNIDEMDFNALRKFAISKGVNVKGIKTIGELKKAVKEVM